jgi:hypothetical protein
MVTMHVFPFEIFWQVQRPILRSFGAFSFKDFIRSGTDGLCHFREFPVGLLPDRALCLPTFSHLLIVNE